MFETNDRYRNQILSKIDPNSPEGYSFISAHSHCIDLELMKMISRKISLEFNWGRQLFSFLSVEEPEIIGEKINDLMVNDSYGSNLLIIGLSTKYREQIAEKIVNDVNLECKYGRECLSRLVEMDFKYLASFVDILNPNTDFGKKLLIRCLGTDFKDRATQCIIVNANPRNKFGYQCIEELARKNNKEALSIVSKYSSLHNSPPPAYYAYGFRNEAFGYSSDRYIQYDD